ncbi:Gfo/Idh/MocA family oxidoreductase [Microbacterium sp. M28]|uniref:Gfo/Idh/MocA family protein n=1 Tax=Microbacterium sp. M28 TaxID=2962064 RepID=UPI0021F4F7D2|nr:Gfo/Idh/MocA family oxidoreductase [Microbacterium sp. M28]UYO96569.1 Gfo/Idh/MocA family oxidoreductase [Microbacterium sp. M28]
MSTLSTAIIGCGVIGRTHVDAVLQLADRLALTALVDVSLERADALADVVEERTGVRPAVHATVQELVAAEPPQLVVVATPSGLHVEQAVVALEAGAHVLIEKPLDVDLIRARRLADAAAAAAARGQVCSVISQHRFDPSSQIVHSAIADGAFGRVTSGVATVPWWRSQDYYDSGDWRGTWALDGGGALMNQGVHTVDLLLWFLGRPVTVSADIALLAHEGVEVEDTAVATLTFDSGALAVLHATTAGYPGLPVRLQVLGSDGSAVIDGDALQYIHLSKDADGATGAYGGGGNQADRYSVEPPAGVDATQFSYGHVRQYFDLLDAIDGGREPLLTVEQALLALAAVRAVYVSAVLGRKVRIDDVIAGEYDDLVLEVPVIEVPAV